MIIPDDVRRRHENISETNATFLEFANRTPAAFNKSNFNTINWGDSIIRLHPWPTFIDKMFKEKMVDAAVSVVNLVKSIPEKVFGNNTEKIAAYYGYEEEDIRKMFKGVSRRHIFDMLARGDFVYSDEGGFKCLEYNIASNLGGWAIPVWQMMYMQHPIIAKFNREYNVKLVDENLVDVFCRHLVNGLLADPKLKEQHNGTINTVISLRNLHPGAGKEVEMEKYLDKRYRKVLREDYDEELNGEIIFCDQNFLDIRGDDLYQGDKKINIILEYSARPFSQRILELFYKKRVSLYNVPLSSLMADKLNLAVLSENEDSDVFSPEERERIKKYIPWSRKLRRGESTYRGEQIILEDFVLANREKLVLKPGVGYSGNDIQIGKNCGDQKWNDIINTALSDKTWVIQEFVPSTTLMYQLGEKGCALHNVVWGTFVFGDQYGGCLMRVLPVADDDGIINASKGALATVTLQTDSQSE